MAKCLESLDKELNLTKTLDFPKKKKLNVSKFGVDEPCQADLEEKLRVACENTEFLKEEHVLTIHGLHKEIERLQKMYTDMLFYYEAQEFCLPDNEFLTYNRATMKQKIDELIKENQELKKKFQESNRALESLDQKRKLEQWKNSQEISEKNSLIVNLQKELESKCCAVAELTAQLNRKKKNSFLRRFSLNSNDAAVSQTKVSKHLHSKKVNQDVNMSVSLPYDSHLSSLEYGDSSHSSLSDKSASDDSINRSSVFAKQYTFSTAHYDYKEEEEENDRKIKLPPIANHLPLSTRHVIRHQLRVDKSVPSVTSETLAIDRVSSPELVLKRLTKI